MHCDERPETWNRDGKRENKVKMGKVVWVEVSDARGRVPLSSIS